MQKEILIDDLILDNENPRFEPTHNEHESLIKMVSTRPNQLFELMKDIYTNDLNPSELPIVYPDPNNKKKYIVAEGNRRITCLKILKKPEIISNIHVDLYKKTLKLLKDSPFRTNSINCLIIEDIDQRDRLIETLHSGQDNGRGRVHWTPKQKQRFKQKTQNEISYSLQLIDYIEQNQFIDQSHKNNLSDLKISNLERLLSDPSVREQLGLYVKNKKLYTTYPDNEVAKSITKLLTDLLSPDFNVGRIYYKQDRKAYINTFSTDDLPDARKKFNTPELIKLQKNHSRPTIQQESLPIKEEEEKPDTSSENISTKSAIKTHKSTTSRRTLIPVDYCLSIKTAKIHDIFVELQKLNILTFTNSVSVLFRVFIELSIDEYIEKESLTPKKDTLISKFESCTSHMKENNLLSRNALNSVNKAISSPNCIWSTNTLNAYVHNPIFQAATNDLLVSWNNLEAFVTVLHKN